MGALDGLRVIDFGQYVAGPLCAMLLADQGADVIRVEPPGGPRWDTPANRTWNRGKRSITLDLKHTADLDVARRLIAGADAVVENFRPGVMERLGLGAPAMLETNPRLVYTSLPGFAEDDPRAGMEVWEGIVGAATATYRARLAGGDDAPPVYTAIPVSSCYAAFVGAASIAAALNSRERDGAGQHIVVPLFDATFTAMGLVGYRLHDPSKASPRGGAGWVRQYRCKDGRWVMFHAANTRFVEQFVRAAGIEDWRKDGLLDRANYAGNADLEAELIRRMSDLFLTRTGQEWEDLVNAAGTPTAICRETDEWLDHIHAREARMVVEVDDPVLGPMLQPGVTPRLDATPGAVRGAAPLPGADSSAIRAEVAAAPMSAAGPLPPPASGNGPLAGVRVLDLCIILAGPTCGRTLAEFGADVIKIDAPEREGGIAFHTDVNRGKRSVLLDLKSPEGREVFWKLVDWADVVVQNYRAGALDRIGISYETVSARKPGIIYASLNAYGHGGPWEQRPGWEQLAQAATGMQMRFGGERPVLASFPVNDYGTGILGAYGVMLALYHRQRTGEGQHVRSALAYTACMLQSPFLNRYEGKTWDEPRGQSALGSSPLDRMYEASDGWLFLAGSRAGAAAVSRAAGLSAAAGNELEAGLERCIRIGTVDQWAERFTAAGIPAHAARRVGELHADPWVKGHGLLLTREHENLGLVTTNGPAPRLSRTPVTPGAPASPPGADAESVFCALGLEEQLPDLVASGVVVVDGVPGL
jgi:crotonobetainyl-CoA:carnitine CoA-transferase CaiB-like acyl-CoA transferase